MNLMSSTLLLEDTQVPFDELQAEQIELFREAWAKAGHAREPRVSVSRSVIPITSDLDRRLFGARRERGPGRLARRRDQPLRPQLHRRARPDRRGARQGRRRSGRRHDPPHRAQPARRRLQRRDARDDRPRHRARDRLGSPGSRGADSVGVSCAVKAVEESARRPPGAKDVQRHMLPVLRQDFEFSFSLRAADSPDAPDQAPFVAQSSPGGLVAALGQLEASRTFANPAHERAPCADPPRRIEEHNRVRALEPIGRAWRGSCRRRSTHRPRAGRAASRATRPRAAPPSPVSRSGGRDG